MANCKGQGAVNKTESDTATKYSSLGSETDDKVRNKNQTTYPVGVPCLGIGGLGSRNTPSAVSVW